MAGAEAVERAHELYRGGRHREALELYSAALAAARGPAQRIALHSNRAACYLKLHDFHKGEGVVFVPAGFEIFASFWVLGCLNRLDEVLPIGDYLTEIQRWAKTLVPAALVSCAAAQAPGSGTLAEETSLE